MHQTIQNLWSGNDLERDFLVHQCQHSNSLYNSAIYFVRQRHFENCPTSVYWRDDELCSRFKLCKAHCSYAELCREFKDNPHYIALGGQCAQQTLKSVTEAFSSYNKLVDAFFQGEIDQRPNVPGYRVSSGLYQIAFPAQAVALDIETGYCRLPMSTELKLDVCALGMPYVRLNGASDFRVEQLCEVRIVPRNRQFYVEYVYATERQVADWLDPTHAMGIDLGVGNLMAAVTTQGRSFIVDGGALKAKNQWYNKRVATLKKGKPQGYWDDELAEVTEQRNRQVRDIINKSARFIINRCLSDGIGTLVVGWNTGIKDGADMDHKNNQEFVQIPLARLKKRLAELCDMHGIRYIETEESYTSKASFLDDDFLPTFGEKPDSWKPSGKRGAKVKGKLNNLGRGGYQTSTGIRINADLHGAVNILRKVAETAELCLAEIGRAALTLPKRYDVFQHLKKSYRELCVVGLQPA